MRKIINIDNEALKKTRRINVKELVFHDGYIIVRSLRVECDSSRSIYNLVKHKIDKDFEVQLFSPAELFINIVLLRRICQELDDIYKNRYNDKHNENELPAYLIDFYDGYYVYDGIKTDYSESRLKYNAFKRLPNLPNAHIRLRDKSLTFLPLMKKLQEYAELTDAPDIKAYFSEKFMQIGPNKGLRIETSGNFKFLQESYKYLPDSFVRNYIDNGNDLNELPLYIFNIDSVKMGEVIHSNLDRVEWVSSYDQLFGADNLPDSKLEELINRMKSDDAITSFIQLVQNSLVYTPVAIDGKNHSFTIKIDFTEIVQRSGHGLSAKCRFKSEPASLLINPTDNSFMLLSGNTKRSAIIFKGEYEKWQIIAFFLYSYYSSDCRYKRLYLPISLLNKLGLVGAYRAYRIKAYDSFVKGKWFVVRHITNNIQNTYQLIGEEFHN